MSNAPLGEFEALVLLAALRLGDEAYGLAIADEIESTAGRPTSRAAVYVTLRRLEKKELISTHHEPEEEAEGRKPRRLVTVESEGLERLRETRWALQRMWKGLEDRLEEA